MKKFVATKSSVPYMAHKYGTIILGDVQQALETFSNLLFVYYRFVR